VWFSFATLDDVTVVERELDVVSVVIVVPLVAEAADDMNGTVALTVIVMDALVAVETGSVITDDVLISVVLGMSTMTSTVMGSKLCTVGA
jgi:hypothetical protein